MYICVQYVCVCYNILPISYEKMAKNLAAFFLELSVFEFKKKKTLYPSYTKIESKIYNDKNIGAC